MEKQKTICIVAPSLQSGGIERALSILSSHFVKKGHKVVYIACRKGQHFYELNQMCIRDKMWSGHYSESVPMGDYNLSIEPNRKVTSKEKIRVDLSSFRKTTDVFSKNLNVQILVKNTNSVLVSLKDAVPARGIAVINALVKRYNQNGIDNKRIVSEATVEFINERLDVINQELGTIERRAEDFKKTNKLTDITSDLSLIHI